MSTIVFLLCLFSFIFSAVLQGRYFIHILQLKGNSTPQQLLWMKKKANQIVPKYILALVTIPLIMFFGNTGMILAGMIFIVLGYIYKPRQYRQPLVITKHTTKIIIFSSVIGILFVLAALWLYEQKPLFACLLVLLYVLTPYIIVFANELFDSRNKKMPTTML